MRIDATFRRQILSGERPALTDEPDLQTGQRVTIERSQVWITVGRCDKEGIWSYVVRDDRPRLLRRTPPAQRLRRGGYTEPTKGALASAAEESAYTVRSAQAIIDAGEAVPLEYQQRLSMEASAGNAWHQEQQRLRGEKMRYETKLERARMRGSRAVPHLHHQVQRINGQLAVAA